MSNPWFRLYAEFATDPKVQMLSEAMQRRLIMLMCMRCSNVTVTLRDEEIAFQLRVSNDELAETKALFVKKGFISEDWDLLNWDKRQFKSDRDLSGAERQKRFREKQKEKSNALRNVTVTLPDTDTDTDTDKNTKGVAPPVDKSGFDEFWSAWPKSERKQDKAKCKAKWDAQGLGKVKAAILSDIATKCQTEKWRGGYIEAPLVYLNGKRWEDGVTPDGPNAAAEANRQWYESAIGMDSKAAELGLPPRGSTESYPAFKDRINAALDRADRIDQQTSMSISALSKLASQRATA